MTVDIHLQLVSCDVAPSESFFGYSNVIDYFLFSIFQNAGFEPKSFLKSL